jgi:hypothetical protein
MILLCDDYVFELVRFHSVIAESRLSQTNARMLPSRIVFHSYHTLNAMIELTMSLPFSFNALTAFFLDTFA